MVFFTIIIVTKYFLGIEKCPLFDNGIANGTAPGWDEFEFKDDTNPNSLRDDYLRKISKKIPNIENQNFIFSTKLENKDLEIHKAHMVLTIS